MVDAMIFIVVMGLVVAGISIYDMPDETAERNIASEVTHELFEANLKLSDILDTDDDSLATLPDVLAASLGSFDRESFDYIEIVMDSLMNRPGSYTIELEYEGKSATIGEGVGTPQSEHNGEFTITFGGILHTKVSIY